jgi:hypothetical protein
MWSVVCASSGLPFSAGSSRPRYSWSATGSRPSAYRNSRSGTRRSSADARSALCAAARCLARCKGVREAPVVAARWLAGAVAHRGASRRPSSTPTTSPTSCRTCMRGTSCSAGSSGRFSTRERPATGIALGPDRTLPAADAPHVRRPRRARCGGPRLGRDPGGPPPDLGASAPAAALHWRIPCCWSASRCCSSSSCTTRSSWRFGIWPGTRPRGRSVHCNSRRAGRSGDRLGHRHGGAARAGPCAVRRGQGGASGSIPGLGAGSAGPSSLKKRAAIRCRAAPGVVPVRTSRGPSGAFRANTSLQDLGRGGFHPLLRPARQVPRPRRRRHPPAQGRVA